MSLVETASNRLRTFSMYLLVFNGLLLSSSINASDYGDQVAGLSANTTEVLAKMYAPDESGAIGRNKKSYFHVRFQRGMHHVSDYGLITRRVDILERFFQAVEYSLSFQQPTGNYHLSVPDELKNDLSPGPTAKASGVAFYASSLALGVYSLETNSWFSQSSECELLRKRLSAIKPKLADLTDYLLRHRSHLLSADSFAPNRLLFNAIAFAALGRIQHDEAAVKVSIEFIRLVVSQIHEDGYFIEGGGFDSSYNGVAAALAFRLLLMGYTDDDLADISINAIRWQQQRVLRSGEISTVGNSRVTSTDGGESFLGRKKDVDAGHTVEAFTLAAHYLNDSTYIDLAQQIVGFYRK